MAVKTETPKIRDYWPKFHASARFVSILLGALNTLIISGAIIFAGIHVNIYIHIVIAFATLLTSVGMNLVLFSLVSNPLKTITAALTYASNEPTDVRPPNPNATHFQREGLRPILQFIYSFAEKREEAEKATADKKSDVSLVSTALNHSSASIIVLNDSGDVVYASKNAPVITTPANKKEIELIFDDDIDFYLWLNDCRERLVRDEKTWLRVPNKLMGDQDRRIFDITASYEKGSEAEVVIALFDRTGLYQPEDDQLDFISFAAHELRGPITVIRGYLDVLKNELDTDKLEDDQKLLLDRLIVSANRLSGYVNNILNASKFDRNHMHLRLSEQQLGTIYHSIEDDISMRASSQNRLLTVAIPEDLPTIAADSSSLGEVLSNLLDNAIKYSHEGGLVTVKAYPDGGNFVRVDVIDNGIGMPASVVGNLFHKFYRSHRSRQTVAGTGIGLYICRSVIESHGGIIEVKSEEGKGSTFSFTVPTYKSVAEKLHSNNHLNDGVMKSGTNGWIKNHAKIRG